MWAGAMNLKWIGPLGLLAALVIGDQIRINRPGHKYRMTVEVETPIGVKSTSGVVAVTPDRSYTRDRGTRTSGDAIYVYLGGGKNLVALMAHLDKTLDPDAVNYVALRAYPAATGKRVNFNDMSKQSGIVPVNCSCMVGYWPRAGSGENTTPEEAVATRGARGTAC